MMVPLLFGPLPEEEPVLVQRTGAQNEGEEKEKGKDEPLVSTFFHDKSPLLSYND